MTGRGRVLILSDYAGGSGAGGGGAGAAVSDSHGALRAAGIDVTLATGFDGGADAVDLGGRDLRAMPGVQALRTVWNPAARPALARLLEGFDPRATIVILHQWTRWLSPAAIALLRPFPTMAVMHDYFRMCPNGAYFDFGTARPCTRAPLSIACLAADCDRAGRAPKALRTARHVARLFAGAGAPPPVLLHVSAMARATVRPHLPDAIHAVLHNVMALPAPGPQRPAYDIGYVGRLEPEKGVALLLRAAAAQGLRTLFVGEGSLADAIDREPGATRHGWQPAAAVAGLMRRCRAIALPSLWPETWGLVTAEAMAAGVPVIVSTRAGSAELVERFGGGLVVDPEGVGFAPALAAAARGGIAGLDARGHAGLAALLSPERHAATVATLARETWGLRLA